MRQPAATTYAPLDTLKDVAPDVWVVDGPVIRFGMPWPKFSFPTRMTILRLADDDLFVHSPTRLTPDLRRAVEREGRVRWIVGPNRLHYWWIPDWRAAFPGAEVYLAPKVRRQAGDRIDFEARTLDGSAGYPWDKEIDTLPVAGDFMTEIVFFHRPSRTLVLTDLIENFEAERLGPAFRLVARLGGVLAPHGGMPRDMRLTFRHQREALRTAVERMIAWRPERIVIAHGRWFETDGVAALRRAFGWLLG
ncbi:MAG: DUF4336 domain-containing protein [Alphaproteobacteria bacterium]|nr:DUF4336 domain-containing protein [Alphaproteobacteria bacterium]